jgi:AraC family transcriptional regulator of arabinose operon
MNNTIIPPMKPIYISDAFWLIRLLEFVSYENYIKAPSSEAIIDNSMRAIFFLLHDALKFNNATTLNYQNKLQKIRKEIYERPDLSWNMDMIAEHLHLSTSYIHKIYKNMFGTSCAQDIINSRIQKSKYLLTYSNLPVSNISIECGYNNVEHFSRQFTKITGFTPSKYRNRNRQ